MKIRKEIAQGQMIPEWHGVAWHRWDTDVTVCYPMPLNILAATVRAVVIWMRFGYKPIPRDARDAYAQGLEDGRRIALHLPPKDIPAPNCSQGYRPRPADYGSANRPVRKP